MTSNNNYAFDVVGPQTRDLNRETVGREICILSGADVTGYTGPSQDWSDNTEAIELTPTIENRAEENENLIGM